MPPAGNQAKPWEPTKTRWLVIKNKFKLGRNGERGIGSQLTREGNSPFLPYQRKALVDTEKIINTLRDARRYIRSVEAWRKEFKSKNELAHILSVYTAGNEVEKIEDALLEFEIIT